MAHSDVVDTIEAHLRANFTACPISIENDLQNMNEPGGPFLDVSFPYGRSEQETIGSPGSNDFREEGAFVLTLALPRQSGTRQGRRWLDDLASTLRGKRIGDVLCWAPQPAVGDDRGGQGPFYLLTMAVPYTFNILG